MWVRRITAQPNADVSIMLTALLFYAKMHIKQQALFAISRDIKRHHNQGFSCYLEHSAAKESALASSQRLSFR